MLNDHTASNGALMMTSCLDRNGGRITIPLRQRESSKAIVGLAHLRSATLAVLLLEVLQPSHKEPLYPLRHRCLIGRCDLEITAPHDRTGSIAVISHP